MLKTILIGATGFVGSNLQRHMQFDALLSSANIAEFRGVEVDLAIVAAGDARKWYANQHIDEDRQHMERLTKDVLAIRCHRIVHLSTVDVYATKQGDESALKGCVSTDAYGGHRHAFEQALRTHFDQVLTIRLPGLYGSGLKKNIIFDISQDRDLSGFNPASTFQWLDLKDLPNVMEIAQQNRLDTLNIAIEPLAVAELLQVCGLPVDRTRESAPLVRYDIRSRHADLFAGRDGYLFDKSHVLAGIAAFLEHTKQEA